MTIIVARISPWLVLGLGLMLATMPAWRLLLRGSSPTGDNLPSVPLYAANRLQFAILISGRWWRAAWRWRALHPKLRFDRYVSQPSTVITTAPPALRPHRKAGQRVRGSSCVEEVGIWYTAA
jgi:hypothetical protein